MPRRIRRRPRRRFNRKRRPLRTLAPSSKIISCKVVDSLTPTFVGGALACYKIQGNSIDDPFTTGSSNQPLGYDQWKALYKKAKVLGCHVKVEVHNGSTSAVVFGVTPVPKNQGTTVLSDFEYYLEVPGTKHMMLSPDVDKGIIVQKRSTKKMLKLANVKDASEIEFDLVTETPPTDNWYFHVWAQPFDQTTAITGVQFIVTVRYLVLLYDYIIPARSAET